MNQYTAIVAIVAFALVCSVAAELGAMRSDAAAGKSYTCIQRNPGWLMDKKYACTAEEWRAQQVKSGAPA